MHGGLRGGVKRQIKPVTVDKCDWAFGPEQIALLSHYVPGMHELSTDWVTLSPPSLTSSLNLPQFFLSFIFHRGGDEDGPFTDFLSLFPSYLHEEQSDTFSAQLLECENCTGRGVWLVDGLSVLIQTLQDDERVL